MIKSPITARPNLFENPFLYEIINYLNSSKTHYVHLKTVVVSTSLIFTEHEQKTYYSSDYRLESLCLGKVEDRFTLHDKGIVKIKQSKYCTQFINELNWLINKEHRGYFRKNVKREKEIEPIWQHSYSLDSFARLLGAFMKMNEEEVRVAIIAGSEKNSLNKGVKKVKETKKLPNSLKI